MRRCATGRTRRSRPRCWPTSSTGPGSGRSRTRAGPDVARPRPDRGGRLATMSTDGIFELHEPPAPGPDDGSPAAPLAVRMRPRTPAEVVGQAPLLAPGAPLRRLVEGGAAA